VGKQSIEHVTIYLSKYISKGVIGMKFRQDVGNNLCKGGAKSTQVSTNHLF